MQGLNLPLRPAQLGGQPGPGGRGGISAASFRLLGTSLFSDLDLVGRFGLVDERVQGFDLPARLLELRGHRRRLPLGRHRGELGDGW